MSVTETSGVRITVVVEVVVGPCSVVVSVVVEFEVTVVGDPGPVTVVVLHTVCVLVLYSVVVLVLVTVLVLVMYLVTVAVFGV